jgi:hypothetical protein
MDQVVEKGRHYKLRNQIKDESRILSFSTELRPYPAGFVLDTKYCQPARAVCPWRLWKLIQTRLCSSHVNSSFQHLLLGRGKNNVDSLGRLELHLKGLGIKNCMIVELPTIERLN